MKKRLQDVVDINPVRITDQITEALLEEKERFPECFLEATGTSMARSNINQDGMTEVFQINPDGVFNDCRVRNGSGSSIIIDVNDTRHMPFHVHITVDMATKKATARGRIERHETVVSDDESIYHAVRYNTGSKIQHAVVDEDEDNYLISVRDDAFPLFSLSVTLPKNNDVFKKASGEEIQ